MDLQKLDALNNMEALQPNIIKLTQVTSQNQIVSEKIPDGYKTLQTIIESTAKDQLGEFKIKTILISLLELISQFSGVIIHLNPEKIYLSPDFSNAKVICGDSDVFSDASLKDKAYRFLSPEVTEGHDPDAQIWWDLGIILYELSSGNFCPFYHSNQQVRIRLIQKY